MPFAAHRGVRVAPPRCPILRGAEARIPEKVGAGQEPGFRFGNTAKRCSIVKTEACSPLGASSSTGRIGSVVCNR